MVGVPSMGLGANALVNRPGLPVGDISDSTTYFDNFALSETMIFVSVVSIVLTALSCIGCLVFHCCPSWIPTKIRPGSKNKENYKKHCATLTIPVVIISDETGIINPPLYQPTNTDDSCKDFEELSISIPANISHTEKLM